MSAGVFRVLTCLTLCAAVTRTPVVLADGCFPLLLARLAAAMASPFTSPAVKLARCEAQVMSSAAELGRSFQAILTQTKPPGEGDMQALYQTGVAHARALNREARLTRRYQVTSMCLERLSEDITALRKGDLKYFSPSERDLHRLEFQEGRVFLRVGESRVPLGEGKDTFYEFVMDRDGNFYVRQSGKHSTLLAGWPVAAAGGMRAKDGALLSLTNFSGHYPQSKKFLAQAEVELGKHRVPIPAGAVMHY